MTTPEQVPAATAQYGTWLSYGGTARVVLAIALLTVAAIVACAAIRLPLPAGPARPTAKARTVAVVTWLFSIPVLIVCVAVDVKHVLDEHLFHATPPADPIEPVTVIGVCVIFLIIFVAGSSYGSRTAVMSAAIGAMAAPMIFEFPFDLIVMTRTYPRFLPILPCTGSCSSHRCSSSKSPRWRC